MARARASDNSSQVEISLCRFFGQHFSTTALRWANCRVEAAGRGRGRLHHAPVPPGSRCCLVCASIERNTASQHFIQHDPKAVDIGPMIDFLGPGDLSGLI